MVPTFFVHYSAITSEGYKSLQEGDEVEFESPEGTEGAASCNVSKSAQSRLRQSLNAAALRRGSSQRTILSKKRAPPPSIKR